MKHTSKLNVAVCISGQLRKLSKTKLPKAFSSIVPDYYIHTWDNEHNPHLKDVEKYFPDATIDIEPYEEVFDTILPVSQQYPISANRYNYAQFYSIQKSFNMCSSSNKHYDIIVRARTDIDLPIEAFRDLNEFSGELEKIDKTLKDFYNQIYYIENFYNLPPFYVDGTHPVLKKPFVSCKISSMLGSQINIGDFFWIMNSSALSKLAPNNPIASVERAYNIKQEYQSTLNEYNSDVALKSPCVWASTFNDITVIDNSTLGAQGKIMRSPDTIMVPGHGDIS